MLTEDKVNAAFQTCGIKPTDPPNLNLIQRAFDRLNGSQVNRQVIRQLYEVTMTKQKADTRQFSKNVVKAEQLLLQSVQKNTTKLNNLKKELANYEKDLKENPSQKDLIMRQLQKTKQLYQAKAEQLNDSQAQLNILRKCFSKDSFQPQAVSTLQPTSYPLHITFLLIIFAFINQLLIHFSKSNFLNLLVCVLLLAMFLLNYYQTYYIRTMIVFLVLSIILDIVWLSLYFSSWWEGKGELTTNAVGFYRYCHVMTIILLVVRVAIIILLIMDKGKDESREMRISSFKLAVGGNRPQNQPITNVIKRSINL